MSSNHFLLIIFLSLLFDGCASPKQIKPGNFADFLGDYSFEQFGEGDDTQVSFWNKQVRWQAYDKIIVDPVILDISHRSHLHKLPHADLTQLQEYIEFRLRNNLRKLFKLINSPVENTLRIRLVITDADISSELANTFSLIHPSAASMQSLNGLLASLNMQGYRANLKGELIDSTTGDLLVAIANANDNDEPWGSFPFDGGDIQALSKTWVSRFSYQLCRHQGRVDCDLPE